MLVISLILTEVSAYQWEKVYSNASIPLINSLAVGSDGSLYGATMNGLLISNDTGKTWDRKVPAGSAGFGAPLVGAVATLKDTIYLTNGNGIYRSADTAQTWDELLSFSGMLSSGGALALGPSGSIYSADLLSGILYRSIDYGTSWDTLRSFPWGQNGDLGSGVSDSMGIIGDIAVNSNGKLYAAISYKKNRAYSVSKSNDFGTSWLPIGNKSIDFASSICLINDKTILAGGITGFNISTDSGATWTKCNRGLETDIAYGINWIEKDAKGNLFAAVGINSDYQVHGVYESSDTAKNWKLIGLDSLTVKCVVAGPANMLFASTGNAIYRGTSTNSVRFHAQKRVNRNVVISVKNKIPYITSRLNTTGLVTIKLVDQAGRTIINKNLTLQINTRSLELSDKPLASGIYLLSIIDSKSAFLSKSQTITIP